MGRDKPHDARQYLNHIRRLQAQNAELAAMLAEERSLRRKAYGWYRRRLESRWAWLFDSLTMFARTYPED